jgi:hypothetical protein
MNIISHRGNLNGRNSEQENCPLYIEAAISIGYDVEVDVWESFGKLYLGHDCPCYEVDRSWFKNHQQVLWCHAKNDSALEQMLEMGLHCFWHENDRFTITSKGVPWCYPNNFLKSGVTVVLESKCNAVLPFDVYGVCTDHPTTWKGK